MQEKKILDDYEEQHQRNDFEKKKFLNENVGFKELLKIDFSENNQDYFDWANAEFEGNSLNAENKKIETLDGHYVRSKSESMIADALYEMSIPYRYESPLDIGGKTVYPDFTVIKPSTGEHIIWEHFGLMDIYKYRDSAINKIGGYISKGYIPTINFIATYETQDVPLAPADVRATINHYIL